MKIRSLPRLTIQDLSGPGGVNKINQAFQDLEISINTLGWDNFKGQRIKIQVRNGVPVVVPIQAAWIVFLGVKSTTGLVESPLQSWRAVTSGIEVTVSWTTIGIQIADVDLFAGVE